MSEYKELIKNFDRIRDYMREFFIFGFKTRNDFENKSKRTYDNEKRRIENYLNGLIEWEYSNKGKNVFISVDSSKIYENPFYRAYKSKSFTDNDIILHFLILDILSEKDELPLDVICDLINQRTEAYFEVQTIRNKLKEYSEYGIISIKKEKKAHYYSLNKEDLKISKDVLNFFSEAAPFGVVGSYLKDKSNIKNSKFQFKHNFIVNCLEDLVLLKIISAIKDKKYIKIENFSRRHNVKSVFYILPLMICSSTQTGRRYLISNGKNKNKFSVYRLDYIKDVEILETAEDFDDIKAALQKSAENSFATAISKTNQKEHFEMTVFVNENKENYIIKRLEREGRGGKVERVRRCLYKYSIDVYDSSELITWAKSFIGRIVEVKGDNKPVIARIYDDIKRMNKMYEDKDE